MAWQRTETQSVYSTPHFRLVAMRHDGGWRASWWAGHPSFRYRMDDIPTLPGSTRDEAETACIVAARELAAELVLAAAKASLP